MKINSLTNVQILPGRQVGNTTRIIDNALHLIEHGYEVVVMDHADGGLNRKRNEDLFYQIRQKLIEKHNKTFTDVIDHYKMNTYDLTIQKLVVNGSDFQYNSKKR